MTKRIEIDIKVPNQTKYLGMIGRIGESLAYSLKGFQGNRRELAYHLNVVLTEALANVMCHANKYDPDKDVKVSISASDHDLIIRVYDQGQGFDIKTLSKLRAKTTDEGGRGIQLIFKLMDQVEYLREGNHNVLEMKKLLT
ncbi:MAG: ATP-binding protein [Deltaproteobacteria bacterium]|jgi:serine/threonine-protein kinase RsbW|nr:ATP-binding protein [Deltaproteobacteria bacterium]MCW8892850.1 ATP-binding protein [Deltaproteobacteria bacterium]MCW9050610.1 ATP-binding protein [Deltaproteobacteria bacterium]